MVVATLLLFGCHPAERAATFTPSPDELPPPPPVSPKVLAVEVEGRRFEAVQRALPDFKVAEPTPEERAALGQPVHDFKFLPFSLPGYVHGSPVGSWMGGLETSIADRGGLEARVIATERRAAPDTSTHALLTVARGWPSYVAFRGGPAPRLTGITGLGGAHVAIDSLASSVAAHDRNR